MDEVHTTKVPGVKAEFASLDLNDKRLDRRGYFIAERVASAPGRSFPQLFPDKAELEAFYRFVENPYLTMDDVLKPHEDATCRRCEEAGEVLVLHDTTEFAFGGEKHREGLGPLRGKGQGFFAHVSLAVSNDDARDPLGLLNILPWTRKDKGEQTSSQWPFKEKEQERWGMSVEASKCNLDETVNAIHVMDREGDDYSLLAGLLDDRFVIRICHDRKIVWPEGLQTTQPDRLMAALRQADAVCERPVKLSPRKRQANPRQRKIYPQRRERTAVLQMSALQVTLVRSGWLDLQGRTDLPKELDANLVRVWEENPPEGEEPVEWLLVTTEPIDTVEQIERVVDIYRTRWLVEEFFKALKTGCAYRKRQLKGLATLQVALAILAPVAWGLLVLRHRARSMPDTPAEAIVTQSQIEILQAKGYLATSRPTVRDALLAVAKLGGHIKRNGEPGWEVIGRGYTDLLLMEQAWAAALKSRCGPNEPVWSAENLVPKPPERCDQS